MWGKWWRPEAAPLASRLRRRSAGFAIAGAARRCATVRAPEGLEYAAFAFLVPLLSPQGWDYVLLLGLPG